MKQPKFNIGDSFETTYLPEGSNYTLMIDGINYTKEEYTFDTGVVFDWGLLDEMCTEGDFLLVGYPCIEELLQEEDKEELPLTQEYIDCYQAQEFHSYNNELDFTRDEGNHYTRDNLDEDELLEVDVWVNTPKDTVNNFLDKMMKEY